MRLAMRSRNISVLPSASPYLKTFPSNFHMPYFHDPRSFTQENLKSRYARKPIITPDIINTGFIYGDRKNKFTYEPISMIIDQYGSRNVRLTDCLRIDVTGCWVKSVTRSMIPTRARMATIAMAYIRGVWRVSNGGRLHSLSCMTMNDDTRKTYYHVISSK